MLQPDSPADRLSAQWVIVIKNPLDQQRHAASLALDSQRQPQFQPVASRAVFRIGCTQVVPAETAVDQQRSGHRHRDLRQDAALPFPFRKIAEKLGRPAVNEWTNGKEAIQCCPTFRARAREAFAALPVLVFFAEQTCARIVPYIADFTGQMWPVLLCCSHKELT